MPYFQQNPHATSQVEAKLARYRSLRDAVALGGVAISDDVAMIVSHGGRLLEFNITAGVTWEALRRKRELNELAQTLSQLFFVEYEKAISDVTSIIDEMKKLDLITEVEDSG